MSMGWAKPGLSKRFHVFSGLRSLCCKWAFAGETTPVASNLADLGTVGQHDCKECFKRLKKHLTPAKQKPE